ncbi:MAG: inositol monophosphatase [Chloroflexi bacterium]|nr:inositol monophosphatase [Chloroflexota bacterium]
MNDYSNAPQPDALLAVAQTTAAAAGQIIRQNFYQPHQISSKGFRDLVTDTDIAAQAAITAAIRHTWPDHGFLTEEEDSALPTSGPIIWVIDPLDGTTNFSRGLPEVCVSIAAMRFPAASRPEIVAAAIYDPLRDELFSAAHGQGAHLRTGDGVIRPLHVSAIHTPGETLLTHDWSHVPIHRQQGLDCINQLAHTVFGIRCVGTAALALAWIAAGRTDAYLNFSLKPWDVAAAALLLAEAGGQLTMTTGAPLLWDVKGMSCIGSNGRVHRLLLDIVTKYTSSPTDK